MDGLFPTFQRLLPTAWTDFTFVWPWYTTRSQSRALLRLLALGVEENLPLGPLVENWAADERGTQKWRLKRLARLLHAGRPLADAVEEVPQTLNDQYLLAIRFDANMGTRTAAMRQALSTPAARDEGRPALKKTIAYFCIVAPIGLLLIAFSQIKITPVLRKILSEFSVPEPPEYTAARQAMELLTGYLLPAIVIVLFIAWFTLATRTGVRLRRSLVSRLFAPWNESISADLLEKLAIATSAGRPLAGTLSFLARYHYDPLTRQRLLLARNEVEQGEDVWQSLKSVGLLAAPEAHLMETAQRLGNRPWALAQLAEARQTRASRRGQRLSTFLLPAMAVGMGIIVLFQALTVFVPLTEILEYL